MQCEGIGVFSVPIWPVKNLIEKSFVHGWLGEVVQGLHPVALMAIAHLFRQICCGCAVLLHRTTAGTQPSPGSSTRSAVFNLLQPFVIPKMCLSARKNAKMLIPLPSASDCHHKTGHAGTTETGLGSAALGAGASPSWAEDCQPAGSSDFVSHREAERPWASGMCPVPTWAARIYHSKWDHPAQETAQQYRWCNSHTAWGFSSEIWAILRGERRQTKELIWAKTKPFLPTKLILTWIHLWIRFTVRLHKHFCWHRGSSRKEQAPGRDRKSNKGIWQDCWLLTTQSAHGTII